MSDEVRRRQLSPPSLLDGNAAGDVLTLTSNLEPLGARPGGNLPAGAQATTDDSGPIGTATHRFNSLRIGTGLAQFDGIVTMSALPTADPHAIGQLWNSSGAVKVSAG